MKILFSPMNDDKERRIEYEFEENVIKATFEGVTDTFDFSGFPDGELWQRDIESTIKEQTVIKAEKKDGVLWVVLFQFIPLDATEEECFPEWKDHTEL